MAEVVILVFLTMPSDDAAVQKDTKLLDGKWEVVSLEVKGTKRGKKDIDFQAFVFADAEAFAKQKEIKGAAVFKVAFDLTKSPKGFTAILDRRKKDEDKIAGVYEIEGDKLRLSFGPGDKAPTKLETTEDSDPQVALLELNRVKELPKESDPTDVAKLAKARIDVRTFTVAVKACTLRHDGNPPPTLESLVNTPGERPIVDGGKDVLIDPWEQPYKYDPKGPKNDGKQPDIWSEGPPGKKQPIGNWPEKKDENPKKESKPVKQ